MLRKVFTLSVLLFLASSLAYCQKGHPYISNLDVDELLIGQSIRCIAFDNNNFAFVGSRKGIANYDGTLWRAIKSPVNAFSINFDTVSQNLYCGFKNEFGKISKTPEGTYKYNTIAKYSEAYHEFRQIHFNSDFVFFYDTKAIYGIDRKTDSIVATLKNIENKEFSGIFVFKNNLYVNIKGLGIHKLVNGKLEQQKFGTVLKNSHIHFSTGFNLKNIIIGTNQNKIFLFNGKKFIQFASHTGIRDFLKENILWSGTDIDQKVFAVTTLTGGCAIIEKKYGKIVDVINYHTGLPDDEILTCAKDNNNGLWLAHEQGISRCDMNLPVRNYATYPGLSGNINDILLVNNKIYVATNSGVYFLKKLNSSHIKDVYVKKASTDQKKPRSKPKILRDSKDSPMFELKKQYSLQSITHQFTPVLNLSANCKQLYSSHNILLAATNYGLFEIYDTIALPVISNLYVNGLCHDNDTSAIYVASLDGLHLLTYNLNDELNLNTWKEQKLFSSISNALNSVVQDSAGRLLIGTSGKVYMSKKDSMLDYPTPIELSFPEEINEPINLRKINDDVYFIQSIGILNYNTITKNIFYRDINAVLAGNLKYILGRNEAWIRDSSNWEPVSEDNKAISTHILSLFDKVRLIQTNKDKSIWIINGPDELIRYSPNKKFDWNEEFKVQFLSVSDNSGELKPLSNPIFKYSNNAVRINLSAPYYLKPEKIKYQYFVEGLKNYETWSNWSPNSTIELLSLAPGKYTIRVRAKNIFGHITDINELSFKILAPFWQTKPFYISAIASFIFIIGLLFYLTNRRLIKKKQILERKVLERTIELQAEKDKTNALLQNILPVATIKELKKHSKVTPRHYDNVTVFFSDFKGFTYIAEKLSPEELVNEIDYCFRGFDKIIDKYKIEKIKTIGDAYMCAGGLPTKYKNNAHEVLRAALDIRDFMFDYQRERESENRPFFEIRIGLHSGPVVAGIVGTRKYAYDIWGDTVNLASRMESSGEPGRVNISEATYNIVKDKFECEARGEISAKNKGGVNMYFVNGPKTRSRKR